MIKTDCGKSKITIVSYKLVYSFLVNFIYCNEVFMGSGTAISLSLSLSLSLWGRGPFAHVWICHVLYMYCGLKNSFCGYMQTGLYEEIQS